MTKGDTFDRELNGLRLAVGGLRPLPGRLRAAEAVLVGKEPVAAAFAEASAVAMAEAQVAADFRATPEYRREVCGVLVRRALETAAERAAAGGRS